MTAKLSKTSIVKAARKRRTPQPHGRAPRKLGRSFYAQPATRVARLLVGKILVRRLRGREYRARIVETEAYLGPRDLASHASKGRTKRTEVLFGPPGHAYVYFIYGMYDMLNVASGPPGSAQAVLIRAATPLDGWEADLSGPGRLTRAMRITRAQNGLDLTKNDLFFLDDRSDRPSPPSPPRLVTTKRIGVEYAGKWKDVPLRFVAKLEGTPRRRATATKEPPPSGRQHDLSRKRNPVVD